MASEHSRTELILENDSRLTRGVGSIVEHVGQRLGMPPEPLKDLKDAAEKACLASFPLIGNHNAPLKVTIQDFPDRVEVTLEFPGLLSAPVANSVVAGAHVDRVQHQTNGGHTRTTLIKFMPQTPLKS